jgi:hypothetical protein
VFIVATVLFSWLAMMIVHEFGHVWHAWLSDGVVKKVVLHPLAISRTDVEPNPQPLFVVWGGLVWGCVLPVLAYGVARVIGLSIWPALAFFAGFCLIANGAYLGVGVWHPVGDAAELLQHGTPRWGLACFGIVTVASGFWLWHGLGPHFGIGRKGETVRWTKALVMAAIVLVVVLVELALSDRM